MPISYRINQDENLIQAKFEGEITLEQLTDYNQNLRDDPRFHTDLRELVELAQIQPRLDFQQLAAYTDWFSKLEPIRFTAIVATTPANFGMARQFQTLAARGQRRIEIFRDLAQAKVWLQDQAAIGED